jgi:hypothetical protein
MAIESALYTASESREALVAACAQRTWSEIEVAQLAAYFDALLDLTNASKDYFVVARANWRVSDAHSFVTVAWAKVLGRELWDWAFGARARAAGTAAALTGRWAAVAWWWTAVW